MCTPKGSRARRLSAARLQSKGQRPWARGRGCLLACLLACCWLAISGAPVAARAWELWRGTSVLDCRSASLRASCASESLLAALPSTRGDLCRDLRISRSVRACGCVCVCIRMCICMYALLVGAHCLYHRQPRPLSIAPSVMYVRAEIPCSRMRSSSSTTPPAECMHHARRELHH